MINNLLLLIFLLLFIAIFLKFLNMIIFLLLLKYNVFAFSFISNNAVKLFVNWKNNYL